MRDPDGAIEFLAQSVIRRIRFNASARTFLQSNAALSLINTDKLVPFSFTAPDTIESPRVPFVSYPFEWCDAQLHAAAQLTLDLSREIFSSGHELKDASAWNVIFKGNKPVFCDHLSFQLIGSQHWRAFGQFVRHFLLPLVASQQCGLKPHQSFSIYRDGIPPDAARKMLGLKRFLTRHWPLMATSNGILQADCDIKPRGKPLHNNLYVFCQFMLDGVKPRLAESRWADYTETRPHYTNDAATHKYRKIAEWLDSIQPACVVDLGCNTGEFTVLSAKTGADVIAVDMDHDSVQTLFRSHASSTAINPLVTNLADMVGGRGWCGDEFPPLMRRLQKHADMLLMLALIHHLMISEGVYLNKIAQMAANITREHLIIELLDESDPMVVDLCHQRKRDPKDFSVPALLTAFGQYFDIVSSYLIPNTSRTLWLLKVKSNDVA